MDNAWKTRVFVIGALGGLVAGLVAAFLYARSYEEAQASGEVRAAPQTMDLVRLGLNVLGLVRQISALPVPEAK